MMFNSKDLERYHAAVKIIEADACEGIRTCTEKFGKDVAGALLVAYLRFNLGSSDRFPPDPKIVVKVNDILKEEGLMAKNENEGIVKMATLIVDFNNIRCGSCKVLVQDEQAKFCTHCKVVFKGIDSNHVGLADKLRKIRGEKEEGHTSNGKYPELVGC